MNALRNRVLLIGRLGQDPERIEFDGDKVKASLRLATNEVYRNAQGEKTESTQWHNVIAWGQLAEIMSQYLSTGSEVAIEGRLVYRQYEDKEGQQQGICRSGYAGDVDARQAPSRHLTDKLRSTGGGGTHCAPARRALNSRTAAVQLPRV